MRVFSIPSSSVEPNFAWSLPGSFTYLVPPATTTRPSGRKLVSAQKKEPSFSGSVVFVSNSSLGTMGSMSASLFAPPSTGLGSVHFFAPTSSRRLWSLRPATPYSDTIESSTFSVPARLSQ